MMRDKIEPFNSDQFLNNIKGRNSDANLSRDFFADNGKAQSEDTRQKRYNMLLQVGSCHSYWDNIYIHAAMPILMLIESELREIKDLDFFRLQLMKEIEFFQKTLLNKQVPQKDISNLSYLLCSYIDEKLAIFSKREEGNISFLIKFHGDSFGGELCFLHLQKYLEDAGDHLAVLALYDFILSLGFKGKYEILERGDLLITDLKHQLKSILYLNNPIKTLAQVESRVFHKKREWLSLGILSLLSFTVILISYCLLVWFLHNDSRNIKQTILAWQPPIIKKINPIFVVPDILQQIVDEGWLKIQKHPEGWLLVFMSDGAFELGSATLSKDYRDSKNIERLGDVLLSYDGDLNVIGHTDNTPFRNPENGNNQQLSEARAKTVADIIEGVKIGKRHAYPKNIAIIGKGESEPIATNDTPEGRKANRRVDILWKTKN